jgi:hypothetical protein
LAVSIKDKRNGLVECHGYILRDVVGQVTKVVTTAERQGREGDVVISLAFSLAVAAVWASLTISKKSSSGMVDDFGCCIVTSM